MRTLNFMENNVVILTAHDGPAGQESVSGSSFGKSFSFQPIESRRVSMFETTGP